MRGLLLCLALLAAAGPAPAQVVYLPSMGTGGVTLPVTSLRQARLASTLLQQYDFSCGSAAIATLLTHHYGHPVSEQAVFEEMYARGDRQKIQREGFSLLDMKNFLAARVPAIVLINENGYHHFVVLKGLQADRVLIGDPSQGTRVMPRRTFDALWTSRLLFVVHNRMESARFNLASDWRVAPRAPLGSGVNRDGLAGIALPKLGPGDF